MDRWMEFLDLRMGMIQELRQQGKDEDYIKVIVGVDDLQLKLLIMEADKRNSK